MLFLLRHLLLLSDNWFLVLYFYRTLDDFRLLMRRDEPNWSHRNGTGRQTAQIICCFVSCLDSI